MLTGTLCIKDPTLYLQIASIVICCIVIIPFLIRKRCLTVVKIIDFIQMAAYFKLINGYPRNRNVLLYLGMRSWGDWADGWKLFANDQTPLIWANEEGVINKSVRIVCTWGVIIAVCVLLGFLKVALDEKTLTFSKYMNKNFVNVCSFAYYFTLQDIAFVIAIPLMNPNLTNLHNIISFALGIVFSLITIAYMVWIFYLINYQNTE
jgi:hypothetical protein